MESFLICWCDAHDPNLACDTHLPTHEESLTGSAFVIRRNTHPQLNWLRKMKHAKQALEAHHGESIAAKRVEQHEKLNMKKNVHLGHAPLFVKDREPEIKVEHEHDVVAVDADDVDVDDDSHISETFAQIVKKFEENGDGNYEYSYGDQEDDGYSGNMRSLRGALPSRGRPPPPQERSAEEASMIANELAAARSTCYSLQNVVVLVPRFKSYMHSKSCSTPYFFYIFTTRFSTDSTSASRCACAY